MQKMNIKGLALAFGLSWGLYMLILGWAAPYGWGGTVVDSLSSLYVGFKPGFAGGIWGGIWGFLDGVVGGALIAYIYNLVVTKK